MAASSAHDDLATRRAIVLALGVQFLCVGCDRTKTLTAADSLDGAVCPFSIYWPPRDPQDRLPASAKPLLRGSLALDAKQAARGEAEVRLVVTIARPSEETDRQFWNSELAFADIPWMDEVRVWDADAKWLWPNLPYLLRLPGQERIERYGGTDPVKHVDNDFAAVLIRKYDAHGKAETFETKDSPLVSAEWHAEGMSKTDLQTVSHVAKSDPFLLHLGADSGPASGQVKVWLIYADFLGARPPRTWPKEREWAGGILAYFEIEWETSPGHDCRGIIRQKRPEEGTRFKWAEWAPETAQVRLSDFGK
ncbi:MAG: hypothetical protein NTY19_04705 [Planctomycetota bacterium]|nr:hypothetical protein [Planctomycetota bacterium]